PVQRVGGWRAGGAEDTAPAAAAVSEARGSVRAPCPRRRSRGSRAAASPCVRCTSSAGTRRGPKRRTRGPRACGCGGDWPAGPAGSGSSSTSSRASWLPVAKDPGARAQWQEPRQNGGKTACGARSSRAGRSGRGQEHHDDGAGTRRRARSRPLAWPRQRLDAAAGGRIVDERLEPLAPRLLALGADDPPRRGLAVRRRLRLEERPGLLPLAELLLHPRLERDVALLTLPCSNEYRRSRSSRRFSNAASPAGRMRPAAISSCAVRMLTALQVLFGLRGVKRMR